MKEKLYFKFSLKNVDLMCAWG